MSMDMESKEQPKDVYFLEAIYFPSSNMVNIFGNPQGLRYLRDIFDDLATNGVEGSHYHLEHYNGLDGNIALTIGRSNKPSLFEQVQDENTQSPVKSEITSLPKDIPKEVVAFVNNEKPLEAMNVYIKQKGVSLLEARRVVDCLSEVRRAGFVLHFEETQ